MKGLSHFSIGVAAGFWLPNVAERASNGSGWEMLICAVAGLLPDTLDFKFARFFSREDMTVDFAPTDFHAQDVAQKCTQALEMAISQNRPIHLRLHTSQIDSGSWLSYNIHFDSAAKTITVNELGIVNMSGENVREIIISPENANAQLIATQQFYIEGNGNVKVDVLSGPTISFGPRENNRVEIVFIPWHRGFSHSLTLGTALAALAAFAFGWHYFLLVAVPFWLHVLVDQLGHLGSNLFWPFTKRRFRGIKLFHSSDSAPNFFAVWFSAMLILFKADSIAKDAFFSQNPLLFFSITCALPLISVLTYSYFAKKKTPEIEEEFDSELSDPLRDETGKVF